MEEKEKKEERKEEGEKEDKKQTVQLRRWFRVWNDHIPIVTINLNNRREEDETYRIEVVRFIPTYFMMLSQLGIIEAFGDEIVKAVLNIF